MHLCFVGNMVGRNVGFIPSQGQIVADLFAADGYRVTCVSSRLNRLLRLAEIVLVLIDGARRFDIVVVETFSGLSFIIADVAGLLCRALNLPLVLFLHGGALPEFVRRHPRWARRVLKRADRLVAPSKFLANEVGSLGFQVSVIPNVIDIEHYQFRERSRISARLIWMRSFHPLYNPAMAVEVLASLRRTCPEATLVMAGTDKGLQSEIQGLAEKMGLNGSVRFTGFLDHEKKINEFASADVYINTNHIDNMPVSVIEARAMGLPVVATKVGGLRYLIADRQDGLLVPDGDVDAMVEAINMLLGDPELTRKISRNGRQAAERSKWRAVRRQWEELFAGLNASYQAGPLKSPVSDM